VCVIFLCLSAFRIIRCVFFPPRRVPLPTSLNKWVFLTLGHNIKTILKMSRTLIQKFFLSPSIPRTPKQQLVGEWGGGACVFLPESEFEPGWRASSPRVGWGVPRRRADRPNELWPLGCPYRPARPARSPPGDAHLPPHRGAVIGWCLQTQITLTFTCCQRMPACFEHFTFLSSSGDGSTSWPDRTASPGCGCWRV